MADNLAARKNADYKIIGSAPSVNKTQVGNAVVPIPYPVQEDLSSALEPAKDVNFNSDPVYLFNSNSSKVTGDGAGKLGGVVSGTVEAKSEPIQSSSSVLINGQPLIRDGDLQNMQGGNTIGKVTKGGAGSGAKISDDGKIVKDEKGFLDGADESSGAGKLVDDVKSGDLADKAEQAVNDNIQNTKDILNEQSKRLDELTDAYNKGGTEELYDQAIQSANREIQEAKDVASAVGEKLGNIPDEIGQWSDEVGVKLDKSLDAIKNGNLQYGFGMMAGTAATAVVDVVNPLKKIKWFAKIEDVAVDSKKTAMAKSKNTQSDGGKDGGKIERSGKNGNNKEDLECGEGGTYGKLKNKNAQSVDMERDHVPSGGALKKRALDLNRGKELTSTQKRKIENIAHALAIPKGIHASHSPTFAGRNKEVMRKKDAANLQKAAIRDLRAVKKGLDPDCRKKYEKYAKKIREITNKEYDDMLVKALG